MELINVLGETHSHDSLDRRWLSCVGYREHVDPDQEALQSDSALLRCFARSGPKCWASCKARSISSDL